jgi:arylsulfatase
MLFADAEQSCTAGSFIIAQSVYRTGLSKVGMPGADIGLCADDPAIAELLKPHRMRPASSARTTSAT